MRVLGRYRKDTPARPGRRRSQEDSTPFPYEEVPPRSRNLDLGLIHILGDAVPQMLLDDRFHVPESRGGDLLGLPSNVAPVPGGVKAADLRTHLGRLFHQAGPERAFDRAHQLPRLARRFSANIKPVPKKRKTFAQIPTVSPNLGAPAIHKVSIAESAFFQKNREFNMVKQLCRAVFPVFAVLMLATPAHSTPSVTIDARTLAVIQSDAAGDPWYPASTTKLMSAYVAFEALDAGAVRLDSDVVMSVNAMSQEAIKSGLSVGRRMSFKDALVAMLSVSANDVAVAIAETVAGNEAAFVARMNQSAAQLGMSATHFVNPNGLFDKKQVTTARDLAVLGHAVVQRFPQYLHFFNVPTITIDGLRLVSRNELLTRYPGAMGLKTGFVCASGRNVVALAEREGRQFIVVVMGATTNRERDERAAMLFDDAFAGRQTSRAGSILDIPNNVSKAPADMRAQLCGPDSLAYVRAREKDYPMGLPGRPSRLGQAISVKTYEVRTHAAE